MINFTFCRVLYSHWSDVCFKNEFGFLGKRVQEEAHQMIYAAQRIAQNRLKRSITSDIGWINPWFGIWFCAEFQRIPHLYFLAPFIMGNSHQTSQLFNGKNNLEGGASEIPMVRLPSLQGVTFVVSMVVFDVSRHGLFGCASVVWSSWEANRLRMTDR